MTKKIFGVGLGLFSIGMLMSQETENKNLHVEEKKAPLKLHHAEPLYIDLMRDLGARKGESEWNIATGISKEGDYYKLSPLVEYEWAVADRLGLEVELPFTVYSSANKQQVKSPGTKLEGIKLSAQYTFLVNEKYYTSMAVGYINEIELNSFRNYGGKNKFFTGNVYNPFLVVAKGWGKDHSFSTMVYAGPQFIHHFGSDHVETDWQINTSIHYLIPNTRNFIGLEINKNVNKERFSMVLRPQMRVALNNSTVLGMLVGVPTNTKYEGFSGFIRLIYEPPHKKKK